MVSVLQQIVTLTGVKTHMGLKNTVVCSNGTISL
jgi:hypothetical protein